MPAALPSDQPSPDQPQTDTPATDLVSAAALETARDAALAAFAAAGSLDELAVARTGHVGDRSAVARARKAIGSLPGP